MSHKECGVSGLVLARWYFYLALLDPRDTRVLSLLACSRLQLLFGINLPPVSSSMMLHTVFHFHPRTQAFGVPKSIVHDPATSHVITANTARRVKQRGPPEVSGIKFEYDNDIHLFQLCHEEGRCVRDDCTLFS